MGGWINPNDIDDLYLYFKKTMFEIEHKLGEQDMYLLEKYIDIFSDAPNSLKQFNFFKKVINTKLGKKLYANY